MAESELYDVIIVGLGPAGGTHRAGVPVAGGFTAFGIAAAIQAARSRRNGEVPA